MTMDDETLRLAAREAIRAARDYMEREIHPALERAWKYYHGGVDAEPMWPIEDAETGERAWEGSSLVVTHCRDSVNAVLPEMYRVFTSAVDIVEFKPGGPEDVEQAKQATAYCNWIWQHNAGEDMLNTSMIDYLVKFTAFRASWEDETEEESETFSGLGDTELFALEADEDIIELEAEPEDVMIRAMQTDPQTGAQYPVEVPLRSWSGRYVRAVPRGRIAIECIPQEDFIVDGTAARADRARCIGQWGERLAADVIATGIDAELVMEHAGAGEIENDADGVTRARTGDDSARAGNADLDPTMAFVQYVEAVVRLDPDGSGIARDYLVIALGEETEVVSMEERGDVYYGADSPYERPHRVIGDGLVEIVMDLQDQATAVLRRLMDNLNRSISPRAVVHFDDHDAAADLQSVFEGMIRSRSPEALTWHSTPFVAEAAFPVLQTIDARVASRTGISAAGRGLDPDILKGQTLEGTRAVVDAPKSSFEYLIRRYALGVVRPLFRAILRLSTAHQNRPLMIRMRGDWAPVLPDSWNAEMDCEPSIGLGTGTKGERMAALSIIAAKQEQLLLAGSPLVTIEEYRTTLADMAEAIGIKDVEKYFRSVSNDEIAAQQDAAQQQAQQAAMQAMETQLRAEIAEIQAKAAAEAEQSRIDHQHELEQTQADLQAKLVEMQQEQVHRMAALRAEFERELALMRIGHRAGNADLDKKRFS